MTKKFNGVTLVCTGCGVELPVIDFYVDKTKPSGRKPACKQCMQARIEARDYIAAKAVTKPKPKPKRDYELLDHFLGNACHEHL